MDDSGNIIYIVFTIVAIVYSIWKKTNSAKDQEKQFPESGKGNTATGFPDFETLFEDTEESEREIFTKEPQVQKNVVAPDIPKTIPVRNDFQEKLREMEKKYNRKSREQKSKKEIPIEVEEDVKEGLSFNLREAVIYSEILKRPDF